MLVVEASSPIAFSAGPHPDGYTDLKLANPDLLHLLLPFAAIVPVVLEPTFRPGMVVLSSGESHLFAANVSQQEQLRGVEKVELSPVNTVEPEPRDLSENGFPRDFAHR